MHRHGLVLVQIPHHEAAQPRDLRGIQRLHFARIALGEIRELIVFDHFPRIQVLQRIRPHQQRHVRIRLAEIMVIHVLIEHDLTGP